MATLSNGHSDETTSLLREEQADDSNKHDITSDISPLAVGNQKLERQIDWKTASLINVSYMVGGGVFVSPALTLAMVGSGGMNIVIWLFASFITMTGVCTYAELGTMVRELLTCLSMILPPFLTFSGGEKEYLAFIYRRPKLLLAYLFSIYNIIAIAGGIASQSTVFGRYLNFALFGSSVPTPVLDRVWAGKFLRRRNTILHLINACSVKTSLKSIVMLTAVKVAVLLLIILTGLAVLCGVMDTDADYLDNLSFNGTTMSFKPYASAFYFSMHGYSGFNAIQYSLDEVKNPIQNLPKIAGSALGLTSVLYLLTIISYMLVLPNEVIKNSDLTVAGSFFTKVFGVGFASRGLPIFIGLSAVGCSASLIFSGSRLVLEASRDGLLPYGHTFGYVNPTFQAPVNALVLQYVIVLIYLLATPGGVYQFIIAFAAWPAYIFFACIGIGVFMLRRREPDLARPFKANSGKVFSKSVSCVIDDITETNFWGQ
ncbi:hypothetical protein INT43_006069 [Umbelopsis isabellina]|uniref:Amino acid transporter n=1 Tax=Mortierella isabellina TaxID=91625 RepID=A0A8H7PJA8_MORIS|nr:hypothetical protein INT43_006069 [Umbelopsis isabellina]